MAKVTQVLSGGRKSDSVKTVPVAVMESGGVGIDDFEVVNKITEADRGLS